jgi:mono/diheme cytochrome c family protein
MQIPNIHMVDDTETITNKSRVVLPESNPSALTKAELYLIIRNGRAKMPSYGHAMSEDEIWAAIHYIRSLPGQKLQ